MTFNEKEDDFSFLFQGIKDACKLLFGQDYEPTTLIADSAPAITNGFRAVFTLENRVNCWAHAIRGIDDELKVIKDEKEKLAIRQDITMMQVSPTRSIFLKSLSLFQDKYKAHKQLCKTLSNGWFADGGLLTENSFC